MSNKLFQFDLITSIEQFKYSFSFFSSELFYFQSSKTYEKEAKVHLLYLTLLIHSTILGKITRAAINEQQ